jgi:hypothetical protein
VVAFYVKAIDPQSDAIRFINTTVELCLPQRQATRSNRARRQVRGATSPFHQGQALTDNGAVAGKKKNNKKKKNAKKPTAVDVDHEDGAGKQGEEQHKDDDPNEMSADEPETPTVVRTPR